MKMRKIYILFLFFIIFKPGFAGNTIGISDSIETGNEMEIRNKAEKDDASKNIGRLFGLGGALMGVIFVAFGFYTQNKKKQKLNNELTKANSELTKAYSELEEAQGQLKAEKKKSDDLLHNILPQEIAAELKQYGRSEARQFDNVTVLFTDFVNFTGISETLAPKELVAEIDICFKGFDEIAERNGLEKIKTIGDAYLAVCGMPDEDQYHAVKAVKAAIEIREFMIRKKESGGKFDIRIGLNTGPLVAGIVGNKKFAYDIWGDTVNMASRIESNSEAGKINISGTTYELVKDNFKCQHRGKIEAKNKGMIDMYFVE